MRLWCVQGRRHRLRELAGAALCALLAAAILGCGRTAPEGFWEPTKDDSAAIGSVIEANKEYFRTGLAELAMKMCDTVLPGSTLTILNKELKGNRFKSRFRLDSLQHVFYTDSYELKYTYIAGLNLDSLIRIDYLTNPSRWETTWVEPNSETTCTVTMAETIPGTLRLHAREKTNYLRDSVIIVPPAETLRLPFYSDTMTPCSIYIEKPIYGSSLEGCVLRKERGEWKLWKMAGGGRFFAPGPADAPVIGQFYLNSANGRVDTVLWRPDTTQYGIQRFYTAESAGNQLLTYSRGDWVTFSNLTSSQGDFWDFVYFNGRRYEFKPGVVIDTVKFDSSLTPGIYRLSFEHIPVRVLWEDGVDYSGITWGVPILIK